MIKDLLRTFLEALFFAMILIGTLLLGMAALSHNSVWLGAASIIVFCAGISIALNLIW